MFKPYSWLTKINQIFNKVSTPGNKNEKDRRKNKKNVMTNRTNIINVQPIVSGWGHQLP